MNSQTCTVTDALLVQMLRMQRDFDRKLDALDALRVHVDWDFDIRDFVLTALGVRKDNTERMIRKYGHDAGMSHPAMFCRDGYVDVLMDADKDGDYARAFRRIRRMIREDADQSRE